MSAALIISFCQIGRSHLNWIENRVRTEVLRREQFLLHARVGPYLTEHVLSKAVQRRLALIKSRQDPMGLIPLQDPGGKPLRDELEGAGVGKSVPPQPDLLRCLKTYLEKRLRGQCDWFSKKVPPMPSVTSDLRP